MTPAGLSESVCSVSCIFSRSLVYPSAAASAGSMKVERSVPADGGAEEKEKNIATGAARGAAESSAQAHSIAAADVAATASAARFNPSLLMMATLRPSTI